MLGLLFVLLIILLILVTLVILFYEPIKSRHERKNLAKKVYKILSHYAEEEDCYLLNDVRLFLSPTDSEPTCFDHLLFVNKYVYVITDYYLEGGIYGNVKDASLFLKHANSKNTDIIPNPVLVGKERVKSLENFISANPNSHLFVAMTVYSSSLIVPKGIHVKDDVSCFIQVDELEDTIKEAEKDSVETLSDSSMKTLVDYLKVRSDKVKEVLGKNKHPKK